MTYAAVTTVVVTRNRWPDLQRSLPHHSAPVILVDNASEDGTPGLVRARFPHVEVIALSENRGAVGRNRGVSAARTPYVAFADDDSWWAPDALRRAAACFDAHPRMALLAARMLVGPEESLDPVCVEMAESPLPRAPDLPGPSVLGFVACGAVVRRDAFLGSGGFDEVVVFGGEEERLALDLATDGWGLAYADQVVAHHHPSSRRDPRARQVRLARNRLLTAVMRRPWSVVARLLSRSLRQGREGGLGALHAVPRLSAAVRARRVLPPEVERERRLLGL